MTCEQEQLQALTRLVSISLDFLLAQFWHLQTTSDLLVNLSSGIMLNWMQRFC